MPRFYCKSILAVLTILGLLIGGGDLAASMMLLAAWSLHEWSHLLTGELFGYQQGELALTVMGGRLNFDASLAINSEAEYFMAFSGPLANWLMVGGVAYLKWLGISNSYLTTWSQINCLMGTINLLPALPLDGGRILHAWLNRHFGPVPATQATRMVTLVIVVLLFGMGTIGFWQRRDGILPLLSVLCGGYLLYQLAALKEPRLHLNWQLLQHKKERLVTQGLLNLRMVLVAPETFLNQALRAYGTQDYLLFYLIDRQRLQLVSEELAWQSLIAQGFTATFADALQAGFSVNLQKPDG
jgi:stage IV sporulation protein FB